MKHRILIIEDNPTNLELMQYLLEEFGYSPLSAEDGEQGLALAKSERPELILCDIQLPKLDGYEVARRLKSDPDLRGIPVIALTALAMAGDREKGLAAGFDGYVSKPIAPQSFIEQVQTYLRPLAVAAPDQATPTTVAAIPPARRATILVIDDLGANIKLLESLLEPFGHHVVSARGMTDAMKLARELVPDLIVSDVHMHEGSGYDLCTAVKSDFRLRDIPVILMTSTYHDEASRQQGLALGAARFIFRPMDSLKLLGEIEDCLHRGK